MLTESDVCVIGAGVSGLSAVKHCLEYGLSVTCYEQRSVIGGLWSGAAPEVSQVGADGKPCAAVYQSIVMNISRTLTSFSDFPLAKTVLPNLDPHERFLSGTEFLEYLNLYISHFNLEPHIQLSTRVLEVSKLLSAEDDGHHWRVTVTQKSGGKEMTRNSVHRYVIVASGFYNQAFIPEVSKLCDCLENVL